MGEIDKGVGALPPSRAFCSSATLSIVPGARFGFLQRRAAGFTLIEIMVVVVIVGILSVIAYPSYTAYVQRGHQADAKSQMMSLAADLERYRARRFSYQGASIGALAPAMSGHKSYSFALSITGSSAQAYTLTASPKGIMAGTETLKINNQGETCQGGAGCTPGGNNPWDS